jgi:hypothetical protein
MNPKSRLELDQEFRMARMRHQFRLLYALLVLVVLLNVIPILLSTVRRIPDNIIASISQAALLITGTTGSVATILVGGNLQERARETNIKDAEIPVDPNSLPDSRLD